jgi:hypothetical protein
VQACDEVFAFDAPVVKKMPGKLIFMYNRFVLSKNQTLLS